MAKAEGECKGDGSVEVRGDRAKNHPHGGEVILPILYRK